MSGTERKPPHDRIAELAKDRGWGIMRLAEELDVDPGHAARLRNGSTGVGAKTARRLVKAFPETTEEEWLVAAARWTASQATA